MEIETKNRQVHFKNVRDFDLKYTLECGQCFRWRRDGGSYSGVIGSSVVSVRQEGPSIFADLHPGKKSGDLIAGYFDFGTSLEKIFEKFPDDEIIGRAMQDFRGIRILRQDPWEVVCSFILSINKRIDHISQIIEKLSERYGKKIDSAQGSRHSFPDVSSIARCSLDELRKCSMGFRAEYLAEVSRAIDSGRLDLAALSVMETEEAVVKLQSMHGIGPKVANCIMLFGFCRYDAFPIDVWIKRAIEKYYFRGRTIPMKKLMKFAKDYFGPYRGYVQEYLYMYARTNLR